MGGRAIVFARVSIHNVAGGRVCVRDRKIASAPARVPKKKGPPAHLLHCELALSYLL